MAAPAFARRCWRPLSRRALGLAAAGLLGAPLAAVAEPMYAMAASRLVLYDVDTGDVEALGEPQGVLVTDLTLARDRQLYGLGVLPAAATQLYRIDPLDGEATLVGEVPGGGSFASALAADAAGGLWMSVGATLYRVDADDAEATLLGDLPREVRALTAVGDRLLAFTVDAVLGTQRLEEIDPATLALEPLLDLDLEAAVLGAGTDRLGRVRFVAQGTSILSDVALIFYVIPDLAAPEAVETSQASYHFTNQLSAIRDLAGFAPYVPDETVYLTGGRFAVSARYRSAATEGDAQGLLLTDDTGWFTFFSESNVELVVKVLDGCEIEGFDSFWVFAAALTDVEVDLTVVDTATGVTRTYHNDLGTPFAPIQDTAAFHTCP